jgi:NADPH:quinone reductase-like Zn-dependent oxidoreductase
MAVFKLENYPTIISSVPAGVVRELGPGIIKVKVGDRIITSTNIWPNKGDPKYGSQQRYVVADELEITPLRYPFCDMTESNISLMIP